MEGDLSKVGKHKLAEAIQRQVKASPGLPKCPPYIKGLARKQWKIWAEELAFMNLDKRPDGPMLEGAALAYQRAIDAEKIINEKGMIVEDISKSIAKGKDGSQTSRIHTRTREHPAVKIKDRAWLLVNKFCSEFGFSPVSRTRLEIDPAAANKNDDLAALLSAPRERSRRPEPDSEPPATVN